jgi:hypothetical protein
MKPALLTAAIVILFSCNGPSPKTPDATTRPLQSDTGNGTLPQKGANPYLPIDLSPVDIAYFPVDYPIAKMSHQEAGPPLARVVYSRPHKQGRTIFGSLLKYGEHWRLGANEATEIELFQNATILNKKVARGRYILYAIPQPDQWTIVFNSNVYSWGLKQDTAQDVYRFTIPVEKAVAPVEFFTMVFQKTSTGADLLMAWDNAAARLPVTF